MRLFVGAPMVTPGLENDQIAFVKRLNCIDQAVTSGMLVDRLLTVTSKRSFSFYLRRFVCPLYWLVGKDAFAYFRVAAVSNAILIYCRENKSYVTQDILQTKVLSIINTLDEKTNHKYEKELTAKESLNEWVKEFEKNKEPASKNLLGQIVDEIKGEILHVAADEIAGNNDGGDVHAHLDATNGLSANLKSVARGILHIAVRALFDTVLHSISPAAHAAARPVVETVLGIERHVHIIYR
jgi:hypothetical protein